MTRSVEVLLVLAACALLVACGESPKLSDAEKLAAAKRCTDAGMIPDVYMTFVQCRVVRSTEVER